jgi:hypothetical protein
VIAGFIWTTEREEETLFTPFAFSRSRFLCASTWSRERSSEGVEACLGYLFLLLHFMFLSFLLCVHDGSMGFLVIQVWDMKFMLFIQ